MGEWEMGGDGCGDGWGLWRMDGGTVGGRGGHKLVDDWKVGKGVGKKEGRCEWACRWVSDLVDG